MSEPLPKSLSPTRAAIIILLHNTKTEPTTGELKRLAMENGYSDLVKKIVSNIFPFSSEGKYVKANKKKGFKTYQLTPYGVRVAKSLINSPGEIPLVVSPAGRKSNALPKRDKREEQQEIKFESLNISSTASNIAENLTNLIQENQNYRNLLLTLRDTIDRALGTDGLKLGED